MRHRFRRALHERYTKISNFSINRIYSFIAGDLIRVSASGNQLLQRLKTGIRTKDFSEECDCFVIYDMHAIYNGLCIYRICVLELVDPCETLCALKRKDDVRATLRYRDLFA